MNYKIEVSTEKNEAFSEYITNKLKEYNNSKSIHHKESRKEGSRKPIRVILTDEQEQWIGGLTADVYWGWCELHYFWISETYRQKGIGAQLLEKMEEEAKTKGATKVLVTTFEFQARSFYEKHGFEVVGEIKDYPPGVSHYTLVKKFV